MDTLFVKKSTWIGAILFSISFIGLAIGLINGSFYLLADDGISLNFGYANGFVTVAVITMLFIFSLGCFLIVWGNWLPDWKDNLAVNGVYVLSGMFSLETAIRNTLSEFGICVRSHFLIYGILICAAVLVAFVLLLYNRLRR